MRNFAEKLHRLQAQNEASMLLLIRPLASEMPAPMHYYDNPFFPFSKAIIQSTRDVVCGYIFDFAAYMAHGAAGAVALERSIAYAGTEAISILHGTFVGGNYAPMVYEGAFGADAATIAKVKDYATFVAAPKHEAFVVENGAIATRDYPVYWVEQSTITLPGGQSAKIAGENVLYSGYHDDFAERCRQTLEGLR